MGNKNKVYEIYEKIAQQFDESRPRALVEKPYLDLAISHLKPGAKILDLGCGMGEPIAQYFIEQGFKLTGIDGSQNMINLASARFPDNKFITCDMRGLDLGKKFDCVIAWHSFFHLPPDDQRKMFPTFAAHLNKSGILIFTSGTEERDVWSHDIDKTLNAGENLYHGSLSTEEYNKLLGQNGFEVITHKVEDPNCGGATVWVAKFS